MNESKKINVLHNEKGFLLVVTMLILVVLTVVGMAALDSSTFEVQISANDRWSKVAFNLADGSVYSTSKLLTEAVEGTADPSYPGLVAFTGFNKHTDNIAVSTNTGDFFKRAMGYMETQTADGAIDPAEPDFQVKPNGASAPETIEVYIIARNAQMIAGGGAEFGAGSAGAGVGSGGAGAAVTFDVNIDGFAGNNTRSALAARYRKVLGAGGL